MKELEKYITDEKTGLKYELVGDYYYPCLKAPEAPRVGRHLIAQHLNMCSIFAKGLSN